MRLCVRPQVDPFGYQCAPVGSMCGPLTELERRSCGADVAGWLNATVPEQITAHYDSGVLRLSIPVAEGAKPRKIEVTTQAKEPTAIG